MACKGFDLENKHRDMYEYYIELMREEGERAILFEKNYYYDKVAAKFYLGRHYAAHIIRQQIKKEALHCTHQVTSISTKAESGRHNE